MKNRLIEILKSYDIYFVCAVIGMVTFLIIYGLTPLNVTNDNWIFSGYDESDIVQHYAGWMAFRNSNWGFPIGMASDMAYGDGTIISFTDSIPWVAIVCKLFRNVLPDTFQYFGIYALLCYILQCIASFKIVMLKTNNKTYALLASVLFCFAPILLERMMRHTGLGSQWLILFAILFYLQYKSGSENWVKTHLKYLLLEILAIGIHPYFLPMIAVFQLLCVIEDVIFKKWISIAAMPATLFITYIFGFVLGAVGNGIALDRGEEEGYGFYSMNLNAPFNPTSCGQYNWSVFLKVHPQILGNYDGFNYLGLGILLGLFGLCLYIFLLKKSLLLKSWCKKYKFLIACCIFLTVFAASNVITFNDKTIITILLPNLIKNLCEIFRASSRMFYPVYYMVFIFVVNGIYVLCSQNKRFLFTMLSLVLAVQLFDIHRCIIQKHLQMKEKAGYAPSLLNDGNLKMIAEDNDQVALDNCRHGDLGVAAWAYKNDLKTLYSEANSGTYAKAREKAEEICQQGQNGNDISQSIIVTNDHETAKKYLDNNHSLAAYYFDNDFYFIYNDSDALAGLPKYEVAIATVSNLTDDNWLHGVSHTGEVLVFNREEILLQRLLHAPALAVGEETYDITNVDYDDQYIQVSVDRNAGICMYPAEIFVVNVNVLTPQ